jgi:glutathione S-transferase
VGIPTLWHIEISHYNEKARWALDYKGVAHRRRAPLPGILHPPVALALSGRPTLPILSIDGQRIRDSTAIIAELERRYPDPPLYPADPDDRARALAIEDYFDEEVAHRIRRLIFGELAENRGSARTAVRLIGYSLPPGRSGDITAGALSRIFTTYYGGRRSRVAEDRRRITEGFERLEAEIQPTGFLAGDSFSVADLSAAALLMHFALPAELQYPLPGYPPALEAYRTSLPPVAVEWVQRIWREHRPASAAISGQAR